MPKRYELGQARWERITHLLPGKAGDPGRHAADNRLLVHGVLWILRRGARWSDLPPRYGPYQSVHKRFCHWAHKGEWEKGFTSLIKYPSNDYCHARRQPHQSPSTSGDRQKGATKTGRWGVSEED